MNIDVSIISVINNQIINLYFDSCYLISFHNKH